MAKIYIGLVLFICVVCYSSAMEKDIGIHNSSLSLSEQIAQKALVIAKKSTLSFQDKAAQKALEFYTQEEAEQKKCWKNFRNEVITKKVKEVSDILEFLEWEEYKGIDLDILHAYKIVNPKQPSFIKKPSAMLNSASRCILDTIYQKPLCAQVVQRSSVLRTAIYRQFKKIKKIGEFEDKVKKTQKFINSITDKVMRSVVKKIIKDDLTTLLFKPFGTYTLVNISCPSSSSDPSENNPPPQLNEQDNRLTLTYPETLNKAPITFADRFEEFCYDKVYTNNCTPRLLPNNYTTFIREKIIIKRNELEEFNRRWGRTLAEDLNQDIWYENDFTNNPIERERKAIKDLLKSDTFEQARDSLKDLMERKHASFTSLAFIRKLYIISPTKEVVIKDLPLLFNRYRVLSNNDPAFNREPDFVKPTLTDTIQCTPVGNYIYSLCSQYVFLYNVKTHTTSSITISALIPEIEFHDTTHYIADLKWSQQNDTVDILVGDNGRVKIATYCLGTNKIINIKSFLYRTNMYWLKFKTDSKTILFLCGANECPYYFEYNPVKEQISQLFFFPDMLNYYLFDKYTTASNPSFKFLDSIQVKKREIKCRIFGEASLRVSLPVKYHDIILQKNSLNDLLLQNVLAWGTSNDIQKALQSKYYQEQLEKGDLLAALLEKYKSLFIYRAQLHHKEEIDIERKKILLILYHFEYPIKEVHQGKSVSGQIYKSLRHEIPEYITPELDAYWSNLEYGKIKWGVQCGERRLINSRLHSLKLYLKDDANSIHNDRVHPTIHNILCDTITKERDYLEWYVETPNGKKELEELLTPYKKDEEEKQKVAQSVKPNVVDNNFIVRIYNYGISKITNLYTNWFSNFFTKFLKYFPRFS